MALSARPIRYIVSGLPTPNSATAGRRPLTPRTTTQVRLFEQLLDKRTGALLELPQLLAFVRPSDTVIVWKLDRLGRSLKDLIETLNILKDRGVDFISLTEKIDTTTPGGKLIFHLMGALAEFERDLIRERTNAGLAAARARGRVGGRPKRLATNGKVALARRLFADPNHSIPEICSTLGISRSTLYRYVRKTEQKPSEQ
jgi:DNA invertase Pin-like site-specific DNA recombinase